MAGGKRQWIGRQFVSRSRHPEESGRTVEVIGQKRAAGGGLAFKVRNVAHPNPAAVGRETTISAETLHKAWHPVETQVGPHGGGAADSLVELLERIRREHDEDHFEEHSGCHTLVLLAAVESAIAACTNTTGSDDVGARRVDADALLQVMGDAMRAAGTGNARG